MKFKVIIAALALSMAHAWAQVYEHNIITVATVDDLESLSPVAGQIIATLGYESAGDGGGNLYRYVAGDASACDAALIFDGPGGDNSARSAAASYPGTSASGRFFAVDTVGVTAEQSGADIGAAGDAFRKAAAEAVEFRGIIKNLSGAADATIAELPDDRDIAVYHQTTADEYRLVANKDGSIVRLSGLIDLADDLTPQLGGALDVNGQKLISSSNGNIDIEPNGTGNVLIGNFAFDADQSVGAGQDNYLLVYDNAGGLIQLEAPTSTVIQKNIESIADGMDYTLYYFPAAFTITEIRAVHYGAGLSTPDIDIDLRHSADRSAAGNQVEVTAMAITSSTTGDSFAAGFEDATVPANSWLWVETSGASGTNADLAVTILGNYD